VFVKPGNESVSAESWKAQAVELAESFDWEARLHKARHTAATALLPLASGVARHGCDGLVEHRDGQAVRTRHHSARPGHRGPAELVSSGPLNEARQLEIIRR
jgi:hypothetical protein